LTPLVTVIIPTFNPDQLFLLRAIYSIEQQSFKNIEIVVVDDGSKYSGRQLVENIKISCPHKKIFLPSNSGNCAAPLNTGILASFGHYVCICAQDDYFHPEKIQIQVAFMNENQSFGMVYSDCELKSVNDARFNKNTPKRRAGNIFNDLILQKFYIPSITVMIRREVFRDVGLYDPNIFIEDLDMNLRIAHVYRIGYIPRKLATYTIHTGSMSQKSKDSMPAHRAQILEKWQHLKIGKEAKLVSNFLDFNPTNGEILNLFLGYVHSFRLIRQPYRLTRIFIGHLLGVLKIRMSPNL
jgi:alpha-1,3-rhamnosyltransferase